MHTFIFIIQGFTAFAFFGVGLMKIILSKEKAIDKLGSWVESVSTSRLKLIGSLEILGSAGLIHPMIFDFYPILTPVSAFCLTIVMFLAIRLHVQRQESFIPALILFLMSFFIFIGRIWIYPVI